MAASMAASMAAISWAWDGLLSMAHDIINWMQASVGLVRFSESLDG